MTKLDDIKPIKAANRITSVLQHAGVHKLPLDVMEIATALSHDKYPDDPIVRIEGKPISGFEGALAPQKNGWGIFYNNGFTSSGQINFTLAHEYGHYELHRKLFPNGIQCNDEDLRNWDSDYNKMESQANEFAATLLMPFNVFRQAIPATDQPDLDRLWETASIFGVSLTASILRWLQYTSRRAVLVVSVDGFILWARSSQSAFKSGLFFKVRNMPPIAVPSASHAARSDLETGCQLSQEHAAMVWLNTMCQEHTLKPGGYDFVISLLHFEDRSIFVADVDDDELLTPLTGHLR